MSDELVAVGRVGPPRGVRGDVFVEPWTDDPDARFAAGVRLRTDPADFGPLVVEASSSAGGKLVVHFAGVDDRERAQGLRGTRLVVAATERPPIDDPDEFYATDLVGLEVSTVDGRDLGPVCDVLNVAGADYLVLEVEGRERLVPFVSAIVPTIDLTGRSIVINPPDGLFDL
ncbi:MAG: ribosome maturation factor RimM [Actinomycetota bacterium]|nr:ribosome maturation factor RimM [Actinomycetota bacterium]